MLCCDTWAWWNEKIEHGADIDMELLDMEDDTVVSSVLELMAGLDDATDALKNGAALADENAKAASTELIAQALTQALSNPLLLEAAPNIMQMIQGALLPQLIYNRRHIRWLMLAAKQGGSWAATASWPLTHAPPTPGPQRAWQLSYVWLPLLATGLGCLHLGHTHAIPALQGDVDEWKSGDRLAGVDDALFGAADEVLACTRPAASKSKRKMTTAAASPAGTTSTQPGVDAAAVSEQDQKETTPEPAGKKKHKEEDVNPFTRQ